MDLPEHVQSALGMGSPVTEDALRDHPSTHEFAQSAFYLSATDFSSAINEAAQEANAFSVAVPKRAPSAWKYAELALDASVECAGVCSPSSGLTAPPTSASIVLAGAWFSHPSVLTADHVIASGQFVTRVSKATTLGEFPIRFLGEWCNAAVLLEGDAVEPTWLAKRRLQLAPSSRALPQAAGTLSYAELFLEAVSETKLKWRFLALYRLLEHGCLNVVLGDISREFYRGPRETIAKAAAALDSELAQFVALVHAEALNVQFDMLQTEFKNLQESGNKFAIAIERSCRISGQLKAVKGSAEKGALIFYKIRCAIVHAGAASPIFDSYADGSVCLQMLLPICESAILQFVGISAT